MLSRLRAFIERHGLLSPGETVAVGYSGGADSTCLLHLLKEAGYDVVAAHLHHGQRAEADKEQALCEEFAKQVGARFMTGRAGVPAMAKEMKIGMEEAGREARYEFFHQVSVQLRGAKVATAHTLDDHVETILLNLARGTGLSGLSGIPLRREQVVRPLLWARRSEARRYCEERGLWFHDDPANADRRFARVMAREDIIPRFEALHDRAMENAARLAEIVSDEEALLDGTAAAILKSCEAEGCGPLAFLTKDVEARLDAERLRHCPLPLVRRGLRLLCSALGAQAEYDHAQRAAEAIRDGRRLSVTPGGGEVALEIAPDFVVARSLRLQPAYRQPLTVPGETICAGLGWRLSAQETTENPVCDTGRLEAVVDAGAVKGNLYVRPFEPGDRMRPIGLKSEKKLQDLLTNAKLSAAAKARLPLVCDMLGPIWAPGVCLSERVAVRAGTSRRLALQFGPIQAE